MPGINHLTPAVNALFRFSARATKKDKEEAKRSKNNNAMLPRISLKFPNVIKTRIKAPEGKS